MKSNIKDVKKYIDSIPNQIKFAASNALNKTTDTALQSVQDELSSHFDITTSWYKVGNKFGARAKKSTKNNLVSILGISRGGSTNSFNGNISLLGGKEHWIYDHEGGGIRSPLNSSDILIPTKKLLGRIGSIKGRAGRTKLNKFMDKSKNTIFERNIGGNRYLLSRSKRLISGSSYGTTPTGRVSKKKIKVQSRSTVLLFLIKKKVRIKDDFDFFSPIVEVFNRDLQKNFDIAFNEALRTMK